MTIEEIFTHFHIEKTIADKEMEAIQHDDLLRQAICDYFESHSDRAFALALIDRFISLRLDIGTAGEDLMLAAYILGKHNQVEDCLKIWEAKNTDFDAYCYVDIQLMVFAGVERTIDFLESQAGNELASGALAYVVGCKEAGDFDDIEAYFARGNKPWFV